MDHRRWRCRRHPRRDRRRLRVGSVDHHVCDLLAVRFRDPDVSGPRSQGDIAIDAALYRCYLNGCGDEHYCDASNDRTVFDAFVLRAVAPELAATDNWRAYDVHDAAADLYDFAANLPAHDGAGCVGQLLGGLLAAVISRPFPGADLFRR